MSTLTIGMRQRDRLPLIAVAVEDDVGKPLDLTTASYCEICFRMVDGTPLFSEGIPYAGTDWYIRQVLVVDANSGIVAYDWSDVEAEHVRVGVVELAVRAHFTGGLVTAPTDHHAYITMRPEVFPRPGTVPHTYGAEEYGSGVYDDPSPYYP